MAGALERSIGNICRLSQFEAYCGTHLLDRCDQRRGVVLVTAIDGDIGAPYRVEQQRRRSRGVEVIIHGGTKLLEHRTIGCCRNHHARRTGCISIETRQGGDGGIDIVLRDLDRTAVMRLQQDHPVGPPIVEIDQIEQVGDIAEALGHLLTLDIDHEAVVHPMTREAPPERHGLSAFVLMMRKAQILTAAMQIEILTENAEAHHHTFAVPTRTSVAPRRRPRGFIGLGELPQHEIGRMALVLGPNHLAFTTTGKHLVERLMRQQPVIGNGLDGEIDTIIGHIGAVTFDELGDHLDHLAHPIGRMGCLGWAFEADGIHCPPPDPLAFLGDLLPRSRLGAGPVDDLVLDIGDIRYQLHLETRPCQIATKNVVHQRGPPVSEMWRRIHRRTTEIDADHPWFAEPQLGDFPGGSVVEAKHETSLRLQSAGTRPTTPSLSR